MPFEEDDAKFLLKICDGTAQGRLRDVKLCRCEAEMLAAGNSAEIGKLIQSHYKNSFPVILLLHYTINDRIKLSKKQKRCIRSIEWNRV